jgi:hypothetical protein
MGAQDSTSGPLLQASVKLGIHVLVPAFNVLEYNLHLLWELIIFLRLETIIMCMLLSCMDNFLKNLCGMELAHSTCCVFNNPPWFYKQLPQSTTDDIEMRVYTDELRSTEDTAIEIIDIYSI